MAHIACDMDDVLTDFVGGLRDAIRKEYDIHLTEDEITEWDLHSVLDPIVGRSWWQWLRAREWLWATFPAVDGAIGSIEYLRRKGHYLELLTSKPEWAEHSVWKWMGKWRPAFNQVTIVGTHQKKVDFSRAEYLIDDKIQNCEDWVNAGRKALLFTRSHNRTGKIADSRIIRVDNWSDVRGYFDAAIPPA